jgi:prephenate dehydrogenase
MQRIAIIGTGLIGASVGLALKAGGFRGTILGWDTSAAELAEALRLGAIDEALPNREAVLTPQLADVILLATPVLAVMDWMQRLAPVVGAGQLLTDVGSTKREIAALAATLYGGARQAAFLPGHPMAGKESGGAALADASLFRGATWLFTPLTPTATTLDAGWRALVEGFGAHTLDLTPQRHDELCAWVSHLPQMLATALSALLEETFAEDAEGAAALHRIGGRALREATRLGASPYSMWRDVALTNTEPIAATLLALEQQLAHLRENLRTPELREEFAAANRFRDGAGKGR